MKARIVVAPLIMPLTKAGLPRKKPFRVNGLLTIEELQAELKKRKDHKTVPEVVATVPKMASRFEEIAITLKEIQGAPEALKGVALDREIEV